MPLYRVQILDDDGTLVAEREVGATSSDQAADLVLGERVVRGAKGLRKVLRAKVYFQSGGQPTMVRYYREGTFVSFTSSK